MARRHRSPLAARDEYLAQDVGAVRDDRIHADIEQAPHDDRLVHRPGHHPHADVVRHRDKPLDKDGDARELDRHVGKWDGWLGQVRSEVPEVTSALGWRSLTALLTCAKTGLRPPRALATAPFAHV